ncbi:MAG: hypothetical protein LBB38_03385 [Puniceicoccales bacterium]|jgi:hypothetical protein|nr:hypothetical protein [Puniceicoccales bacterium]
MNLERLTTIAVAALFESCIIAIAMDAARSVNVSAFNFQSPELNRRGTKEKLAQAVTKKAMLLSLFTTGEGAAVNDYTMEKSRTESSKH